jgi:hypothetical protein
VLSSNTAAVVKVDERAEKKSIQDLGGCSFIGERTGPSSDPPMASTKLKNEPIEIASAMVVSFASSDAELTAASDPKLWPTMTKRSQRDHLRASLPATLLYGDLDPPRPAPGPLQRALARWAGPSGTDRRPHQTARRRSESRSGRHYLTRLLEVPAGTRWPISYAKICSRSES